MVLHKKSRHFYEKIEEILFPEERENKIKKDNLMKNFFGLIVRRERDYKEKAMEIYKRTRGMFEIN
jgi:hypothetical protein